ncbi:spoIIIJ-associated protein [Alkalithermobacter thermoalcaliphilus JW-YL-7 = DSM 7308]|uniref:RNA-binding protein KhpB n=1 Tax=Alkalithermobacter thermoalcaliphilus JW-YL-7 = DSM 7308 TaxID=1121328 RepID=A0A150FT06_CLOPD|nr:single-stranded nucleic acid binding R3H domain-containing protein [[Clostridium] paradoxum JW-YL-7 = DSM 7308]SHL08646.1 spoIIIJ-associated protein [[Clostridium] paradoxum JW-YL-7 = DSM 7308]
MRDLQVMGKTVQEAVDKALLELNAKIEDVDVYVLEEPSKGFLGIIGAKPAKVRVVLKDTPSDIVKKFLEDILKTMDINCQISIKQDQDILKVDLKGNQAAVLIGRRGETLDSLQLLSNLALNKHKYDNMKVILDIENYRQKREQSLTRYAQKMAKQAVKLKKDIKLEPMNPYERRVVHSALQNDRFVTTTSEGEEPNRRVVISLKRS